MRKHIYFTFIIALLLSCGETKEISENSDTPDSETSEINENEEEIIDMSAAEWDGIIVDKTNVEGCTFLIKTDLGNGDELLEPVHLQEEYRKDGLKVNFTFTYSKRPSKCGVATPILLGTITG